MAMTRRKLLKTGIAGTALLTVAGLTTKGTFWGAGSRRLITEDFKYRFLTNADRTVLQAVMPVLLADAFKDAAGSREALLEETIRRFDVAVSALYPAVQAELRQLFSLLTLPPGRMLVAGVWSSWSNASRSAIYGFLNGWRTSRFDLLKSGYDALQQLSAASWYGNPKAWPDIGYQGPPVLSPAQR